MSANFCPFFDFFKSWSIVDLQCISFRYTAQWFETHTLTHYIFFIHSSVNRHSGCFLLGISFIELKFFILIKADLSTFLSWLMLFCFISIKSLSNPRPQGFLVCFNLEVVGSCILYLPMIHFVVSFCKRCIVSGVILLCTHVKLLQSCSALCDTMDHNLPGASVHGILQARILNWVAISSSRGSSWPRDRTWISYVSCIGRWVLYHWYHLGSPSGHPIVPVS